MYAPVERESPENWPQAPGWEWDANTVLTGILRDRPQNQAAAKIEPHKETHMQIDLTCLPQDMGQKEQSLVEFFVLNATFDEGGQQPEDSSFQMPANATRSHKRDTQNEGSHHISHIPLPEAGPSPPPFTYFDEQKRAVIVRDAR